jgi:septal ring factor EnvC (AmiA/AmiB activator)
MESQRAAKETALGELKGVQSSLIQKQAELTLISQQSADSRKKLEEELANIKNQLVAAKDTLNHEQKSSAFFQGAKSKSANQYRDGKH